MQRLPDNDRAIKNCRPKPGQQRTRWTVEGRKGLTVDVSVRPSAPADEAQRQSGDFRRVYYFRDRRHEIDERLGDVEHLPLAAAWKAVQARHAETTLHGPRSGNRATFGELFAKWLDYAKKRPLKSWSHEEAMYERHLKRHLAHKIVSEMRKRDFVAIRDQIAKGRREEEGKKKDKKTGTALQADKAMALVTRVLNWCEKSDRIEEHSAKGIPPLAEPVARDRVFSQAELRMLWPAFDEQASKRVSIVLRILLLTGLRVSEVVGMKRAEMREDETWGKLWEVPAARMKNKLIHVVPVNCELDALLSEAISLAGDSPYVFPGVNRKGGLMRTPMSRNTPDHKFAEIAVKLEFFDDEGKSNCGLHDLRRTMATGLARLGFDDPLIDRVQGRVKRGSGVTWIYNRYDYLKEKRAALEAWERELLRIVSASTT